MDTETETSTEQDQPNADPASSVLSGGRQLMTVCCARLDSHRGRDSDRPPSGQNAGWLAAIRAGITVTGEAFAGPAAGPYLPPALRMGPARSGAIRAAAIRAISTDTREATPPEGSRFTPRLGSNFAQLHRAEHNTLPGERPNQISQQVHALPLLDMESAATVLLGLIRRCGNKGVPVNFQNLADTLTDWGNGIDDRSRKVRERIVNDYYGVNN